MKCQRCDGRMRQEIFSDFLDDTGKGGFRGWRCMICGEIFDPVISINRKREFVRIFSRKKKKIVGVN